MTREEAISEISKIIFELGFEDTPSTDKRVDALNMAIEALKQEPKTDVLDKIIDEVCDIDDEIVLNPDSLEGKRYVRLIKVIDIIDKYKAGSEE